MSPQGGNFSPRVEVQTYPQAATWDVSSQIPAKDFNPALEALPLTLIGSARVYPRSGQMFAVQFQL